MAGKTFSPEEVKEHSKPDSLWIIVNGGVYDLTKFQDEHPGGKKILARVGGTDASKPFAKYHSPGVLKSVGGKLLIGKVSSEGGSGDDVVKNQEVSRPPLPAPSPVNSKLTKTEAPDTFGDMVPYGDPDWYQGYRSPYYNASHVALRAEVRQWVEEEIAPYVDEWDEKKAVPPEIMLEAGRRGYLAGSLGLGKYPVDLTDVRPQSVHPEDWDNFHEYILTDEIARCASGGVIWNLLGGFGIGMPPVVKYAKPELVKRIAPDILAGKKRICLCITEPEAGSDVANLTTTAKKTADGKHYIVNGVKKWITNGYLSEYFTVAVRTGGPGMKGISMLMIERSEGVNTRKMDVMGVWGSATTWVTFEDVKVPVENLIGKENGGFKVIMSNFNHERLGIIIQATRFARICYEESVKYSMKRKTFGKRLYDHDVIRAKLANMAIRVEATSSWLETLIYQTSVMDEMEATLRLGGAIAGCKAQSTLTFEYCAREAAQIFGGLSYSKKGQGGKIERLYRDVRAYAIPGGSEEIMLDLSMRQAVRVHKTLGAKF